jgi:GNAT superfamily N-acetyltransferase
MSCGPIELRNAGPEDEPFLAALYFDTRRIEVSAWGWPEQQQEWFLRMQFEAQQRSYRTSFPHALNRIVTCEDLPIGRLLVDYEASQVRLIDIALIEERRDLGIGTQLLRALIEDCQARGCSLLLQAVQGNPARRLYERMGFELCGADPMYVQMQWKPLPQTEELACQKN